MVSADILTSRWYVRCDASVEDMRKALGEIQPLARGGAPVGEVACLTAAMTQPELMEKLKGFQVGSLFRVL